MHWSGYAFEALCYKQINPIKRALGLTPIDLPDTWRYTPKKHQAEKGAQIDSLFNRHDDATTVCEIKYTDNPFTNTKAYANGLQNNLYAEELISNCITLEDFFS